MKEIQFVEKGVAKLVERPVPELKENLVLTKTLFTAVSAGTEKANLLDKPNTFAYQKWPKVEGYSAIGVVEAVGSKVTKVKPGDKVLVYHGTHAQYSVVPENRVYLVKEAVNDSEAVLTIIGAMGLGGLRKTKLELGESAMIIGLGLLGMFALLGARASGAYPVIAVDINEERRKVALELGADFAFDPTKPDFVENVKRVTDGKGVNAIVEVTGVASALVSALDVAARQGRIALNGCTRVSDAHIDFYKQVHCPGITIIGAHNMVRPLQDCYQGYWTNEADVLSLVKLISGNRINVKPLVNEIHSPNECETVYQRLCNDVNFPIGVVFDWSKIE